MNQSVAHALAEDHAHAECGEDLLPRYRGLIRVLPITWPSEETDSIEENLVIAEKLIAAIKPGSADLVCLPEGFLYKGVRFREVQDLVKGGPASLMESFRSWARYLDSYLFVPIIEERDGRYFNVVLTLDCHGFVTARYTKMHPWPSDPKFAELERGITPGGEATPIPSEFGPLGVQTCFDVNWATGWDQLRTSGCKFVLFPSEYPGGFALRCRAWQIRTPVMSAVLRGGPSQLIDLTGEVLVRVTPEDHPTIAGVNLNRRLVHFDHNWRKLELLCRSCPGVTLRRLADDNVGLVEGPPDGQPVATILEELGIRDLDEYLGDALAAIRSRTF